MTISTWENYALLVITPESQLLGVTSHIIEYISRQNVDIIGATLQNISASHVSYLYEGRATYKRKHLIPEARILSVRQFSLGPSLLILLHGEKGLQSQVASWKGRSGSSLPGKIRSFHPSSDRFLSLVHSPDDTNSFLFETKLLWGNTLPDYILNFRKAFSTDLILKLTPQYINEQENSIKFIANILAQLLNILYLDPRHYSSKRIDSTLCEIILALEQFCQNEVNFDVFISILNRINKLSIQLFSKHTNNWVSGNIISARAQTLCLLKAIVSSDTIDLSWADALCQNLDTSGIKLTKIQEHRVSIFATVHFTKTPDIKKNIT